MLKCASVFTRELDDIEVAVDEIKSQLQQKLTHLEHSIGIIQCHTEFIATGAAKAVCESLPFQVLGATSSTQAVNDAIGEPILTIFVMTSDTIQFRAGLAKGVDKDVCGSIKLAFEEASSGLLPGSGDPTVAGLAIIFPPFFGNPGDSYVDACEKASPGTPIFGGFAVDDSLDLLGCETIFNGQNYKDSMPFLLCFGDIRPRFMVAGLTPRDDLITKGLVTKACGTTIHEIDGMSAFDFFYSHNFFKGNISKESRLLLTPLVVDLIHRDDYDGIPVVRGHYSFSADGSATYTGVVEEGATFSLSLCEVDDILKTATKEAGLLNGLDDVNGALVFSCSGRRIALMGVNNTALELQTVKDVLRPDIPFMMGYAGGEICPTSVKDGMPTNRFHNFTLIILAL
ncbi:MAG: FIST C-terminal domain-containing protein [Holophagaceae bacterium]|nr:FIST C-terminal domain-containing protein [Holophagaceae bacterium]